MRICLVHSFSAGLEALRGAPPGGAEKQIGLLARTFTRRGHQVTLIALEYSGPPRDIDGIAVRAAFDASQGVRFLRFATHRLPNLRRELMAANAHLYYVRGAMAYSRSVVEVGRSLDAPVLLGLASDRDLYPDAGRSIAQLAATPTGKALGYALWLAFQRRVLHEADAIVAQNTEQADRCASMGLPHVVIPSIVERPGLEWPAYEGNCDVVWAGNVRGKARRPKGVGALTRVVESLPQVRFAVVGDWTGTIYTEDYAKLRALPNVDVLGGVHHDELMRRIAGARLVLNTSPAEGFSNVMLEGWSLGKPTVTLSVNPSGLLSSRRWPPRIPADGRYGGALGVCAGDDVGLLTSLLVEALGDEATLSAVASRCRDYVAVVHDPDVVCSRYEDLAALPRP